MTQSNTNDLQKFSQSRKKKNSYRKKRSKKYLRLNLLKGKNKSIERQTKVNSEIEYYDDKFKLDLARNLIDRDGGDINSLKLVNIESDSMRPISDSKLPYLGSNEFFYL